MQRIPWSDELGYLNTLKMCFTDEKKWLLMKIN